MSPHEYDNILYTDLLIKIEGFNERLDYELDLVRNSAFASYISGNLDPKKMAKTVDSFWPKDKKGAGPKVTDKKRARLAEALKKYNEHGKTGD